MKRMFLVVLAIFFTSSLNAQTFVCPDEEIELSIPDNFEGTIQWQFKRPNGNWIDINGATSNGFLFNPSDKDITIRAKVTQPECEPIYSEIQQVVETPDELDISLDVPDVFCSGESVMLKVQDTFGGDLQWQTKNGNSWANIEGATTNNYEYLPNRSSVQIRARISFGDCGQFVSNAKQLNETGNFEYVNITTSESTCDGNIILSLSDEIDGAIQWQINQSGEWVDIAGATSNNFNYQIESTTEFRALLTANGCEGSTTTDTKTVEVLDLDESITYNINGNPDLFIGDTISISVNGLSEFDLIAGQKVIASQNGKINYIISNYPLELSLKGKLSEGCEWVEQIDLEVNPFILDDEGLILDSDIIPFEVELGKYDVIITIPQELNTSFLNQGDPIQWNGNSSGGLFIESIEQVQNSSQGRSASASTILKGVKQTILDVKNSAKFEVRDKIGDGNVLDFDVSPNTISAKIINLPNTAFSINNFEYRMNAGETTRSSDLDPDPLKEEFEIDYGIERLYISGDFIADIRVVDFAGTVKFDPVEIYGKIIYLPAAPLLTGVLRVNWTPEAEINVKGNYKIQFHFEAYVELESSKVVLRRYRSEKDGIWREGESYENFTFKPVSRENFDITEVKNTGLIEGAGAISINPLNFSINYDLLGLPIGPYIDIGLPFKLDARVDASTLATEINAGWEFEWSVGGEIDFPWIDPWRLSASGFNYKFPRLYNTPDSIAIIKGNYQKGNLGELPEDLIVGVYDSWDNLTLFPARVRFFTPEGSNDLINGKESIELNTEGGEAKAKWQINDGSTGKVFAEISYGSNLTTKEVGFEMCLNKLELRSPSTDTSMIKGDQLSLAIKGNYDLNIQWEYSYDRILWNPIEGLSVINAFSYAPDTTQYVRAVFDRDKCDRVETQEILITVCRKDIQPTMPPEVWVTNGNDLVLSVDNSIGKDDSYLKWYILTEDNWKPLLSSDGKQATGNKYQYKKVTEEATIQAIYEQENCEDIAVREVVINICPNELTINTSRWTNPIEYGSSVTLEANENNIPDLSKLIWEIQKSESTDWVDIGSGNELVYQNIIETVKVRVRYEEENCTNITSTSAEITVEDKWEGVQLAFYNPCDSSIHQLVDRNQNVQIHRLAESSYRHFSALMKDGEFISNLDKMDFPIGEVIYDNSIEDYVLNLSFTVNDKRSGESYSCNVTDLASAKCAFSDGSSTTFSLKLISGTWIYRLIDNCEQDFNICDLVIGRLQVGNLETIYFEEDGYAYTDTCKPDIEVIIN